MRRSSFPDKVNWQVMFLSFAYAGRSPIAPGTVGSFASLPLIWLLSKLPFSYLWLAALISILTGTAVIITENYQHKHKIHDPQWIVIDEVIGMLVTWSFFPTGDMNSLIIMTVIFRFFDIVKLWPASYFDNMKHGAGTILDDVISGLFAGLVFLMGQKFLMPLVYNL